ncbi:MAG: exodeoxyribonuclease III [Kiritimatiellae bacterium]|nr:exodeoxyribonuclease III [Kiritimatiellia bacterium]
MRVATFNVNSIRSRLGIVLDWLAESGTDVLCLQETKCQDPDFPESEFRAAGWQLAFRGEKSYNGVALVSRLPLEKVSVGFEDGGPTDGARLISAVVNGVRIVNTYVPQGRSLDHEMYAYKLEWFKRLHAWLEQNASSDQRVLWCGDLNVARTALDVHNAKDKTQHVCYHLSIREAFEEVLAWGFTDVFRQFHPEEELYSFFDYRVKDSVDRNIGWRIDYLLATPALAEKCRNSFIDLGPRRREKPSDHTVMVADFDL